jgi:thiamine biosynthesis lipoprotein
MGTDAHVVIVGGRPDDGLLDRAQAHVDRLERRWSRFLPDSEVSELNRRAGHVVAVSADTAELVRRAVEGWWLSGGAFDPTVLGAVLRAGYDRSFETLGPDVAPGHSVLEIGTAGIVVDGDTVRLPAGVGFDPGGIGKGLAADLVLADLLAAGAEGACVNLGGDVAVAGTGPEGDGWTVAVEHELAAEPVAILGLATGAVATSTTLRRRWGAGSDARHHLIDPRTGLPSDSDLDHVAVVAATAWAAEVLAKAVLLRGSAHPFDILGGTGAEALAVGTDRAVRSTPGLAAYLGGAELPGRLSAPRVAPTASVRR